MGRYSNYKQSSYDWLGRVPQHWDEKFLEQTASEKCVKNSRNTVKQVLSLSYGEIKKKNNLNKGLIAQDLSTYQIVEPGDIIMRLTDLQNDHKSLRTGIVKNKGIITAAYLCLCPKINPEYLHYTLRAYDVKKVFYGMGGGVRQSIGFKDVRHMYVPVPPRAEQDQIVRFLDWKVSEINKLIGIRRKEIKELEKLCWIVIVNAISKVKQKNISEWKRVRVKQICRMQSGTNLISQVIGQSGNYPVYGGNGLRGYYKNYTNDGQYVIIGRQGALAGNVHLVEGRFWATDHAIVVYCSKFLIPRYAYYLFTGMNLNQYAFNAAAQPGLSVTKILNLQCDVPSVARQLEIADRLDEICIQLEKIVNNTKKKIKLLQELKSVIISDVVTGKIDVRNIPVPAYEHVDNLTADDGEGNDEETGIPGEED
ncbi:MAG: restriction endonuclease subunit S [Megasphaera elsdenii]|nr:restriction endonuclease subunit S [Megasphaera elsdenii]